MTDSDLEIYRNRTGLVETQAEQLGALKAAIRLIHEREWPAGDKTKAAKHAAEMWAIADAARNRWNF